MIKQSSFKPAWWLRNHHLQTIWPKLFRPFPKVETRQERLELPDGDFLDLNFTVGDDGPIVLVLHGLEGSLESKYAAGILKALHENGYRGVLMHFRGCSGVPNRLPRGYHSGETSDPQYVIDILSKRYPGLPISAVGFSLGGNALLKLLGELNTQSPLCSAVAVSVPLVLDQVATRMNTGFSRIYQKYLIRSLIKSTCDKHSEYASTTLNLDAISKMKTFWEFDDQVTASLHGFSNGNDYYSKSSSRQYLKDIATPTLVLHAKDDPFMTQSVIPQDHELSPSVTFELSDKGGHVGFVSGNVPWYSRYWLEDRIIQYLDDTAKEHY